MAGKNKKFSPLKAIRKKCLDCAGTPKEVRLCGAIGCPLWDFRIGRRPETVLKTDPELLDRDHVLLAGVVEAHLSDFPGENAWKSAPVGAAKKRIFGTGTPDLDTVAKIIPRCDAAKINPRPPVPPVPPPSPKTSS